MGGTPTLGRISQISGGIGPVMESSDSVGFRDESASADFLNSALNFALFPVSPRPSQAASLGCETKKGALWRMGRQVRSALGDADWVSPPSLTLVLRYPGKASRRVARWRRLPNSPSGNIGLPS